jgi:hypothetical protein
MLRRSDYCSDTSGLETLKHGKAQRVRVRCVLRLECVINNRDPKGGTYPTRNSKKAVYDRKKPVLSRIFRLPRTTVLRFSGLLVRIEDINFDSEQPWKGSHVRLVEANKHGLGIITSRKDSWLLYCPAGVGE